MIIQHVLIALAIIISPGICTADEYDPPGHPKADLSHFQMAAGHSVGAVSRLEEG
jgi:hypothetical protein